MGLYADWMQFARMQRTPQAQQEFWKEYFDQEGEVYKKILDRIDEPYTGKLSELAGTFDMEPMIFAGFIDGINTSLKAGEYDLDSLEIDSDIDLSVDTELLYYNMLDAKADWLYGLEQWNSILTDEKRLEIARQYRKDRTYIAQKKVGRNEPCPCGSGKKYKACHGKPGAEEAV